MGSEAPGAAVFGFAHSILQSAIPIVRLQGATGGFWQIFDAKPDDESFEPEVCTEQLDRDAARALLRRRRAAGFVGLLGFCSFEAETSRLYVEAYDVRTDMSISLGGPMRRTLFGKLKPDGEVAEVLGAPTL